MDVRPDQPTRGAVYLALAVLVCACGGGTGGDPVPTGPPTDFAGSWYVEETIDRANCGGLGITPRQYLAVIAQSPVSATQADISLDSSQGGLDGRVAGGTATMTGALQEGQKFRVYAHVELTRSGAVISGTGSWVESPSPTGSPSTCSGTSVFRIVPEMTLLGFNLPSVAGVALDQPLIFTFSDDVDPASVTPDNLSVTGAVGPTFSSITADGIYLACLPRLPSAEDFSDAGLAPGVTYSVFLAEGFDPTPIHSVHGAPLTTGGGFTFQTSAAPTFIEPRRPLVHLAGPLSGPNGRGDEDGCLNDAQNSLYTFPGFQTGTDDTAQLLCLVNEGAPRIVPESCLPVHDQRGVGAANGSTPGTFDLPTIRVAVNEAVDPSLATQWAVGTGLAANVQLWRVGDVAGNPVAITASNQIPSNKPVVVQTPGGCDVTMLPAVAQAPGTYLVLVRGLTDLAGNAMPVSGAPDPVPGGYAAIDAAVVSSVIPSGYRSYFRTP